MKIPEEGYLLRVFVGESDKQGHIPLYEAIVLKAREAGMGGATVLRGLMGFGKRSVLHTAKILRLSEDLPMVIEIVDSLERRLSNQRPDKRAAALLRKLAEKQERPELAETREGTWGRDQIAAIVREVLR